MNPAPTRRVLAVLGARSPNPPGPVPAGSLGPLLTDGLAAPAPAPASARGQLPAHIQHHRRTT
jgi:hypothetical protein